jgi:hypothetical protein
MKKLSNWFIGVWLSFCSYLELWPDSMTHVWMFMPDDLKSEIPDSVVKGISYSVLVLSMFGKMHAMNKANKRLKDESKDA